MCWPSAEAFVASVRRIARHSRAVYADDAGGVCFAPASYTQHALLPPSCREQLRPRAALDAARRCATPPSGARALATLAVRCGILFGAVSAFGRHDDNSPEKFFRWVGPFARRQRVPAALGSRRLRAARVAAAPRAPVAARGRHGAPAARAAGLGVRRRRRVACLGADMRRVLLVHNGRRGAAWQRQRRPDARRHRRVRSPGEMCVLWWRRTQIPLLGSRVRAAGWGPHQLARGRLAARRTYAGREAATRPPRGTVCVLREPAFAG